MKRSGRICLNGWWDFRPVYEAGTGHMPCPADVPGNGWKRAAYLVPGSWVRPESQLDPEKQTPWTRLEISDNFGYPAEWSKTRTAWARRKFSVDGKSDRVWRLIFDAVMPESHVFVNGRHVAANSDRTMRFEADITDIVREGPNEVAVFITDNPKNENNKYTVFEGGFQTQQHCGIWQDVWLESRPRLSISDITIVTSVTDGTLSVECEFENRSAEPAECAAEYEVWDGAERVLSFRSGTVTVPAQGTAGYISAQPWMTYTAWSPETPHLYVLRAKLGASGDEVAERFGFREFGTRGADFVLNGKPVRLFGDWGHKENFDNMRPEYLRQWFRMLKDANMNYVRFHTYPHPEIVLDIADETGILVSHESAWHFGGGTDLHSPDLWNHAADHVRRIVRSRKNHPCIVLWSVGNETRFSGDLTGTVELGPMLRGLYKELDPTRVVYHEGDSSLWDEREQEVISRHYGVECTGEEWWDGTRPLHVGESSRHHYGQPPENLIFGTDEMYASYSKCSEAISEEAADIIEQARANGVGCICPWNLMCLDNYRPVRREVRREWPDYGAPGIKPLRSAAYGPEFNWNEPDGKGYVPGAGFDIIAHAYRKVAVIVRERLSGAYAGSEVRHTVTVVNDGRETIRGAALEILVGGTVRASRTVDLETGGIARFEFTVAMPRVRSKRNVVIKSRLAYGKSVLDEHERAIVCSVKPAAPDIGRKLYLLGEEGGSDDNTGAGRFLSGLGLAYERTGSAAGLAAKSGGPAILIMEPGTVREGDPVNREIAALLDNGWRVLVMEQTASIFPPMRLDILPVECFHIRTRGTGVWDGLEESETGYWGNSPYGKKSSDALTAEYMYFKPGAIGNASVLADAGNGDFGVGGLKWTPLFELESGRGLVIASQLMLTDRLGRVPAADRIFLNLLRRLDAWQPLMRLPIAVANDPAGEIAAALGFPAVTVEGGAAPAPEAVMILNASGSVSPEAAEAAKSHAADGGTVVIWNTTAGSIDDIRKITGKRLRLSKTPAEAYSLVRAAGAADSDLIDGISHHETFWLDRVMYASMRFSNNIIAPALFDPRGTDAHEVLVTETASCWKEFFVDGGSAELYRMPTVTMLLQGAPRRHAIGLAEIKAGGVKAGRFILCQFRLPWQGYEKAMNLWSYFLGNLGAKLPDRLLEGEAAACGLKVSDGWPGRVRWMAAPDEEIFARMAEMSGNVEYRIPNQKLEGSFPWQTQRLEGGALDVAAMNDDGAGAIALMFQVRPGRPRKLVETEGGLPNPELQTSFVMQGSGTARVVIHGREYGTLTLTETGGSAISAIDLDADWNSCLILYKPADRGMPLRLEWRNSKGRAETEFGFRG